MRAAILILALSLVVVAGPSAHHRFGDTYVEKTLVTIEGEVSQWIFRDPHSYVHVVSKTATNESERWIVECRGAGHLARLGLTRESLKPGQRVVVTGNPGRIPADHRLLLRGLHRADDDWRWPEETD
jgi:hypothetical protein